MGSTGHSLFYSGGAERIPFVSFDGADFYPGASAGTHWTPEGHKLVAERILDLLSGNNIVGAGVR